MITLPGGADKGKPLDEVSEKNLRWWSENAKQEDVRQACLDELARREGGEQGGPPPDDEPTQGQQATPATSTQAKTTTPARTVAAGNNQIVSGTFRDANSATDALTRASQRAHLVAPATVCATLPEGCEVALAAVMVDVANETYNLAGKVGLGKTALDKIAAAAGVSWDPVHTGRLDDRSDPHYVHYRAVGTVPEFDGRLRMICGEVEIDARDGSPQIDEIVTKARKATDSNGQPAPRDPSAQILELRKFLLRHAESKAKNRAIRSLGVRTSYAKAELQRPFVVARLMFTGQSEDPEARQYFRGRIADAMLGSTAKLYGGQHPQSPAPAAHRPPAIGAVAPVRDFIDVTHSDQDAEFGADY